MIYETNRNQFLQYLTLTTRPGLSSLPTTTPFLTPSPTTPQQNSSQLRHTENKTQHRDNPLSRAHSPSLLHPDLRGVCLIITILIIIFFIPPTQIKTLADAETKEIRLRNA
ncbi:hypothetical protein VTJ04DRAFT_9721 [Mycothermus thermophilus]|uniref:uncharacterized protein n=1 Tax=Humicola insolens TaxID=85995 RepID=UPI003741ED38